MGLAEGPLQEFLLALDAENAFCSADRAACLRKLCDYAPELLPCAELFSRRTSQYFFWDSTGHCHRLTSTSGVDQGDPLAPRLFCFGLKPKTTCAAWLQSAAWTRTGCKCWPSWTT